MHTSPPFFQVHPDNAESIGDADLLPRHPIFRTHDLEHAREHLAGVFTEHSLAYLTKGRRLDFRHRQAKLGAVAINSLRFGVGVAIKTPAFSDFYLVQFTLSGGCRLSQGPSCIDTPAGSIAIINPFRPFALTVFPGTRRLMLRVDRLLVEREFRAWTGSDLTKRIEFDQQQTLTGDKVGMLARYVRMLCDDLKTASSALEHPLVRDRIASALVSTLLVSMPDNMQRELEPAARSIAPFFVRRVEFHGGKCSTSYSSRRFGRRSGRQCEGVAVGVSSLSRDNTNGVPASPQVRIGTEGVGPGRTKWQLRRRCGKCLWVRPPEPIRR